MIGIYGIYRKSDDVCVYVGQSKHIELRVCQHFTPLQKYNKDEYYYKVIEECDNIKRSEMLKKESYWIDKLSPVDNKQKTGRCFYTQEFKQKMSELNKGKHHSEEAKQKMREAKMGEKNYIYGKHHSEETKQKISTGNKGKHVSEETRQKMREANIGRHVSEETRKKISEGNKGKHVSEETKQKMRKPKRKRINNV